MVRIARNPAELKKRVLRFFDPQGPRKPLVNFIESLSSINDVLVFGGCVRDIALYGVKLFSSDIDLVFSGSSEELTKALKRLECEYELSQNKFGGYRTVVKGWDVDLWAVKSTWAFKKGHVEYRSIDSLLETTITNWDAIFYNWNENKIICGDNYFSDMQDGYLTLNLSQNPNLTGCLVRILRFYFMKKANLFSPVIRQFIIDKIEERNVEDIVRYEIEKYPRDRYLNSECVINFLEEIKKSDNELIPTSIEPKNITKDMFKWY